MQRFYPKDVIVRMSDFKVMSMPISGGKYFEPDEENPMIGFRGASVTTVILQGFALNVP
jgi:pyruvate,water dikinase